MVRTHRIRIDTAGQNDAHDVTPDVARLLAASGLRTGEQRHLDGRQP
jgi:thiamine phosphate synthase YjbQ (UPF0047 family)